MSSEKTHLIIIGFGPVASYKYSRSIRAAMERDELDSYSIVDLESQRNTIFQRIKGLPAKPKHVYFIPNPDTATETWADISPFKKICRPLLQEFDRLKVLITTEPKAHEAYLSYCIDQNIDSLVTKPIILPMKNKMIDYSSMLSKLADLAARAETGTARHAVLCLGRYHEVYEKMVREPIQQRMLALQAPITSLHLKTSGGVWNLADEFYSREDHPYKYGYGMLMHGAYHYVDVVTQFLQMNKALLAKEDLSLSLTSFSAFPKDQSLRIPESLNKKLEGYTPARSAVDLAKECLGETDIVTIFSLRNKKTDQVLGIVSPFVFGDRDSYAGNPNMRKNQSCFRLAVISRDGNNRLLLNKLNAMLLECFDKRFDCVFLGRINLMFDILDCFCRKLRFLGEIATRPIEHAACRAQL